MRQNNPEYRVVHIVKQGEEEAIKELELAVSRFLEDGWETTGGIALYKDLDLYYHLYQAIVRI